MGAPANRPSSSDRDPKGLVLRAGPHLSLGVDTPTLMRDVIIALLPLVAAAGYNFGAPALLVVTTATVAAMLTEWVFRRGQGSLLDGSALLTGLILGLTLPPGLPLWMAVVGGLAAIGLGKLAFGGLGYNLFNPALVGRAFLQAAFPTALTTWRPAGRPFFEIPPSTLAPPLLHAKGTDALTTATPLSRMKFEHKSTDIAPLLMGSVAGSLGETSGVLILIGGAFLAARRAFDVRIPLSILLTVAALSGAFYWAAPGKYPDPMFMLSSGGLLFGAVYMATDPVTSPLAPRGAWIFGAGVGVLVVLIRLFGGLPEGVMYAILLMNAATPLIERISQPRPFGRGRAGKAASSADANKAPDDAKDKASKQKAGKEKAGKEKAS